MKKGTIGKIALGGLGLLAGIVGGAMLFKNKKDDDYLEVELTDVEDFDSEETESEEA